MKKSVWDIFAPIYERAMKSQKHIYDFMYEEISSAVKGKSVLELATGPGMIARHIAPSASSVIATDFSPKMIETAQKKAVPENVSFELADAADLRFSDKSFDAVIIANALHVMPNPEKALAETAFPCGHTIQSRLDGRRIQGLSFRKRLAGHKKPDCVRAH